MKSNHSVLNHLWVLEDAKAEQKRNFLFCLLQGMLENIFIAFSLRFYL